MNHHRLTGRRFDLGAAGTLETGEVFHHYPGKRALLHATLDGRPVVAKFFVAPVGQAWEWWRSVRGGRALEAAGVPAPALRYAGFCRAARAWLTVLDLIVADEPWPPTKESGYDAANRRLVATLARHHAAGIVQNDLNWRNFIPRGGVLYAIDTDRIRGRRQPLGRRRALRHLVRLYATKTRLPEALARDGLRHYAAERQWTVDAALEERFMERVRRMRRRHAAMIARRAARGWKHFVWERDGGAWVLRDRHTLHDEQARPLLEAVYRQEECAATEGIVEAAGMTARWRRVPAPGGRSPLGRWLQRRAGRRAWVELVAARRLGLAAERQLALVVPGYRSRRPEGALLVQEAPAGSGERIAVLIAYTGDGGVEKMVNHLLHGMVAAGADVDVLLLKAHGGHVEAIPEGVRTIRLDAATSMLALPALCRYLRCVRPRALLAAKDRAGRVALLARRLTGVPTRVVLRMGMHLSGSLTGKTRLQKAARYWPVRRLYPWADAIVTVADSVADDLARIGGIPRDRFVTIANPTIPPDLDELAARKTGHPWLDEPGDVPVILAAGRCKAQKDFPTLLRAFALVHARRPARLIVLGDGPDRSALLALRDELGLSDAADFPGFDPNPYAWMRAADLFVLSSRFEGSPNVLTEAMALGTRVAATDCPGGARALLDDGRLGPLAPVGDAPALAEAMERALDDPADPEALRRAVSEYTVARSSQHYLQVLGGSDE